MHVRLRRRMMPRRFVFPFPSPPLPSHTSHHHPTTPPPPFEYSKLANCDCEKRRGGEGSRARNPNCLRRLPTGAPLPARPPPSLPARPLNTGHSSCCGCGLLRPPPIRGAFPAALLAAFPAIALCLVRASFQSLAFGS
ncbi:hypothetical protein PVAP13_5NG150181 [Panicum virgatum]|uniref:Uncharacterized protein n=1 Tax=Panicum virgatum TaxID=38727 RepID=A0A8T0RMF5_PANVG|nr:hypothetical protein PVAP13_5NG150181 [Panicum virgatum]